MMKFRALAIVGMTSLASCTGDGSANVNPAPAPPPVVSTSGDVDTPNGLPDSITNSTILNTSAGVVGVTHLPP